MKIPTKIRSIEKIVEEQIQIWNLTRMKKEIGESVYPVVTISREPGSGGRINYDLLINTETVSVENAVEAIGSAAGFKKR